MSGSRLGKIVWKRLAASAMLAAAAGWGVSCGRGREGGAVDEGPPVPVRVETAIESDAASWASFAATVEPYRRATPGTILVGRVDEVLRREGEVVRAGEVLARVESREVAARLAQADAGLSAARVAEENARRMRERFERLHERQAASQKSVEDAVAGHAAARAALRVSEEQVRTAQMYLGYSEVRAPFPGTVVERRVEVGDTAAPGMPLFVLEDLSRVKIEAEIPESSAERLKKGDPVEVLVGEGVVTAPIGEILPAADPRSRTFKLRVVLVNDEGRLRSGAFVRVRTPGALAPRLTVPDTAVVRQGPLQGVFVVDPSGVARLRWLSLGARRDARAEVLAGLSAGERYVVEPPSSLRDGARLEVR